MITACTRSRRPSLVRTLATWVFTVACRRRAARRSRCWTSRAPPARAPRARARVSVSSSGGAGARAAGPGKLLDHAPRHRRGEQRVAARDDPHGLAELVRRGVLEQEPAGAGAQRREDVLVEVEGRHDEHAAAPSPRRPRCAGWPRCPSMPGIRTSIRTTSGRARVPQPTASAPSRRLADDARCRGSSRGSCGSPRASLPGRRRGRGSPARHGRSLERHRARTRNPPPGAGPPRARRRDAAAARACRAGRGRRRGSRDAPAPCRDLELDRADRRCTARRPPRRAAPRAGARWSAPPGRCGRPTRRARRQRARARRRR